MNAVDNLNSKTGEKQEYKPAFGVLKDKEGKPDYLKTGVYLTSFIPTCRRMQSGFDAADDENHVRVAGMAAVAAANLPGDLKDIALAVTKPIGPQTHQPPLPFFRGTCLNFLTKKYEWLGNLDKTLFDTKIGKSIINFFNLEEYKNTEIVKGVGKFSKDMPAHGYKGNLLKRVAGTSLLRTSVIGLGLSCFFELPAIINAARKGDTFGEKAKSVAKQTIKSAGNVALITGGIAAFGSLFYLLGGFGVSLFGMAIGSTLGVIAANKLGKQVDKIA